MIPRYAQWFEDPANAAGLRKELAKCEFLKKAFEYLRDNPPSIVDLPSAVVAREGFWAYAAAFPLAQQSVFQALKEMSLVQEKQQLRKPTYGVPDGK